MKKYRCYYVSGGGAKYDGGVWGLKETPALYIFTLIEEPFYEMNWNRLVIHKDELKNKRHSITDWEDGTFTIYPDRCGTPHVFEPLSMV